MLYVFIEEKPSYCPFSIFPVPIPAQWVQITGLFQFMFRFSVAVIQGEGDFSVRVRVFASHVTGKEHLNFCLLLKLLSPVK